MNGLRHQAQHAARALEFFERTPARVELVEQLGMDRINLLQLAPIVLVRTALREIVGVLPQRAPRTIGEITMDATTLRAFGSLGVPGPIWRTLQRLGAWVEPVLVGEWARLIQGFALRMSCVKCRCR